jgi:hypothetical protein
MPLGCCDAFLFRFAIGERLIVMNAFSFSWMFVLIALVFAAGCTACSTTPKESSSEALQHPSALPCPVTQTMCTMEFAPVRCVMKQGPDELAAVEAENACRGKIILNEKWCALSAAASSQGKKPPPVVECTKTKDP